MGVVLLVANLDGIAKLMGNIIALSLRTVCPTSNFFLYGGPAVMDGIYRRIQTSAGPRSHDRI